MSRYSERAKILDDISEKAPFYTPEWRYNPDEPDAGTALSFIWADMLSESTARVAEVPEAALYSLLNVIDTKSRPAKNAQGILSFFAQPGLTEPTVIPTGTRVLSPADGEPVLETLRDLPLSAARISGIYEASGEMDSVGRVCSREGGRLFGFSERNTRIWSFEHPFAFDVSAGGGIRVRLDCGKDTENVIRALTNGYTDWELLSPNGWMPVSASMYGADILLRCEYEPGSTALRFTIGDSRVIGDAIIRGISFAPHNERLVPQAVSCGDIPIISSGFFPFGERFMIYDTLNIACDEALGKPGALVELSFSVRIIKLPIEGFPRPEQEWKAVLMPWEIIKIEEREISASNISWEYYNGVGWNSLVLNGDADGIFNAGETAETRVIRFICPDDICTIGIGAHEKRFIRARILAVENAFSMYGYYLTPWMENLSFNYVCEKGVMPERTVSFQNMDERVFGDFRSMPPLVDRSFRDSAVYFEFEQPFSTGSILWQMKKNEENSPSLLWEYMGNEGWDALGVDGVAGNFSRTGIMCYNAPLPPAKARLFGSEAYWMRAVRESPSSGRERQPELIGIWENSVPARAVIPGPEANRGQNSYTVPASPINGVSGVTNPLPITGGAESETDTETLTRVSRAFSHGGKAVTRWDVECLAMEGAPGIIKCRCVPNTGADGLRSSRDTCLAVFSRDLEFDELSEQIAGYILPRYPVSPGRLHIVAPIFITVSVSLTIMVGDISDALAARSQAKNRLISFIDPAGGYNGGGWDIGELPTSVQIHNALRDLGTAWMVADITISYTLPGGTAADYCELMENPFILPENGEHEVTVICRN